MLLKEYLNRDNKQQKELAEFLNIDKMQMSKIANYKCLPTPEQADKLCKFLNCNILDIYRKKEIDLIKGTKKASRNKDDKLYYRLSVRLNLTSCNCLKIEKLKKLGYSTIKEWVLHCLKELEQQQKRLAEITTPKQANNNISNDMTLEYTTPDKKSQIKMHIGV